MTTNNRYVPFAAVALVASVLGWGASTWMNREQTAAQTLPTANHPAVFGLQPNAQVPMQLVPQQSEVPMQMTGAPLTYVAMPAQVVPAQVATVREAAAPVVRTAPVRTSTAAVNDAPVSTSNTRKKGMSNKAKAAIAIGGGAGVGAAIGGIAKGGKGAAIGALIGAGSGAVYSVIRHKQNKPVF